MLGHLEGRAQRLLYDMYQTYWPVSGNPFKSMDWDLEGLENHPVATKKAKISVVGICMFVGRAYC